MTVDNVTDAAKQATSWIGDFQEFISRGNVVELAVAVAVGGAFTAIVNSLVNDISRSCSSLDTLSAFLFPTAGCRVIWPNSG